MLKGWKFLFLHFSVFIWFEFFHPFKILSTSRGGNFSFCHFLFLFDLNFSTPFSFYHAQGVEFHAQGVEFHAQGVEIFLFAFFCFYFVGIFPPLLVLSASRGGKFCFCFFLFLLCLNFSTPFSFYQSQGVEIFVFSFFCFYLV